MRTVEDETGRRYLLVKRSGDSSLVRDVESGEERYLPNDELTKRDGIDPLEAAAGAVPGSVRRLLTTVHDDRGLGLVITLARQPRPARALLEATDLCESDLLGLLSELRAAGMVVEETVDGERGYAATEEARRAVEALSAAQSADASSAETSD